MTPKPFTYEAAIVWSMENGVAIFCGYPLSAELDKPFRGVRLFATRKKYRHVDTMTDANTFLEAAELLRAKLNAIDRGIHVAKDVLRLPSKSATVMRALVDAAYTNDNQEVDD